MVDAQYGIGGLFAVAVWSELGDCRRFSRSEQVVRHTGLDVTVDASDRRRAGGYLSRQGPADVALGALRGGQELLASPQPRPRLLRDVKEHHDGKLAAISMARKLARRCFHVLRAVDPDDRLRDPGLTHSVGATVGIAHLNITGHPAVSSCNRRARQHPCWTAFKH